MSQTYLKESASYFFNLPLSPILEDEDIRKENEEIAKQERKSGEKLYSKNFFVK